MVKKFKSIPAGGRALLGCAFLGVMLAGPAQPKDLGVQGAVWPIIEIDIRELLMKNVGSQNWDKANDQLVQSGKAYLDNLPKRFAPPVSKTKTQWMDPSFVLDNDIWAPLKNKSGDYEWQIAYAKGTRANPLEFQRPYNAMLFFDANSLEQVSFVGDALQRHPGRILPIELTGANPLQLTAKWKTPVFSATEGMLAKYPVNNSPSLLYPGDGPHRLELGLTTFAAPYSVTELENTWPEGLRGPDGVRR